MDKKLKFLCLFKDSGEYYRLQGFGNALISQGHEFAFWNHKVKPAFDVFDEYNPDVFIGTTYDLTQGLIQCIAERPHMKVVLKGGNWGPMDRFIDRNEYPILFASTQEIQVIAQLKQITGKPDFIMCHYHPDDVEDTMSDWRKIGCEPLGVMNAADAQEYVSGEFRPELVSDIAFVGGYWPYKARNLNRFIVPLCDPVGQYRIKIFGNQQWPVAQYLGQIDTGFVRHIFASANVCPNVSEPHSNKFGFDIIERPFKIAAAGGFCVSDHVKSLFDKVFTKGEVPCFKTPEELRKLVDHFILPENADERNSYVNAAFKTVMNGHTYNHRMRYLIDRLYPV